MYDSPEDIHPILYIPLGHPEQNSHSYIVVQWPNVTVILWHFKMIGSRIIESLLSATLCV